MPLNKLKNFLDEHETKYVVISHSPAYTAQGIAASAHISGKEVAKTVIIKVDGKLIMAVLPASSKVDLNHFKNITGASNVELAKEEEFRDVFPDCELGAMPPFGNLYDLDVLAAESLTKDEEIAFNAGSHKELIKMAYKDYGQLVKPCVLKF